MTSQPPIQPSDSDVTQPSTIIDTTEHRLRPLPKKDTAKAWLLTLILHFVIAGGLMAYWYTHQRTNEVTPIAVQLPSETANKTHLASPPSDSLSNTMSASTATLSTITTLASTVANAPSSTASSTPLASYLAQKNLATANPANLPSNKVNSIAPSTTRMVAVTTMTQKVITGDAPIKKALTQRDLPSPSATDVVTLPTTHHADTPQTAKQNTRDSESGNEIEKEASQLSKDIDVNNDELSQLIEQVKKKNQQKIDEQQADSIPAKPTVSESTANSAPKNEPKAIIKPASAP